MGQKRFAFKVNQPVHPPFPDMSSIQASATYDGPREGCAFKTGPEGVAYYKDSGDGGHGLEADVQMQELELEQEELDAAEGWCPTPQTMCQTMCLESTC